MSKDVQFAGGPADSENSYVGSPREIRIDTSNNEIRVHDGTTPGGHRVSNLDSLIAIFQEKSVELSGLEFGPAARGFLTRIGDGTYALRKLSVGNALVLVNESGVAGNPIIGLQHDIPDDRRFLGNLAVDGVLTAPGGVVGNTSGTHTGNTTGTHTGNVTGNVTGDLLGNTAGTHTGAVDARGRALQLDPGTITYSMLNADVKATLKSQMYDVGDIRIWGGALGAIPAGWHICDGTSGTPNFSDHFLIGAGGTYAPGDVGGTTTHLHTADVEVGGVHGHGVTVANHTLTIAETPAHRHGNGIVDAGTSMFNHGSLVAVPSMGSSVDNNSDNGTEEGWTTYSGADTGHTHAGSSADNDGSHDHGITVANATFLPPYVAVAYIMRIS